MAASSKTLSSEGSVATKLEQVLSAADLALHKEVIAAWCDRFCGTRRKKQESFDKMQASVERLTVFVRKPFWKWQTGDLDTWFAKIGRIDKQAISTQRIIQSNIACFLDFACEADTAGDVERRTGVRPRQVCTPDIRIPHRHEREGKRPRRSITAEHMDLIFSTMRAGIQEAVDFGGKDQHSRERDMPMIYVCYGLGLRREECCSLTTRSFEPNPARPEFGNFGIWHIYGKGDKYRTVYAIDPLIVDVMNWYLESVRPKFLSIKTANCDALFLSERGLPISDDQLDRGFRRILDEAGLMEFGYSLHCLRHSYVSEAAPLIGLAATQEQVGHTFQATTQGYCHTEPKSIDNQINKGIDTVIKTRKT